MFFRTIINVDGENFLIVFMKKSVKYFFYVFWWLIPVMWFTHTILIATILFFTRSGL